MLARAVDHFAEQQPAAVAQARVVDAELVAGIDHGAWLGGGPQAVPGAQAGQLLRIDMRWVEVEQGHRRRTADQQLWLLNGLRQYGCGKVIAEPGEAVVEVQRVECHHAGLRLFPSSLLGINVGL